MIGTIVSLIALQPVWTSPAPEPIPLWYIEVIDGDGLRGEMPDGTKVEIRIADIDAPEKGGVGAAIGGAKCERERVLGFKAWGQLEGFLEGKSVTFLPVGHMSGDRIVSRVIADHMDVGMYLSRVGPSKHWRHTEDGKPIDDRASWCH
ncbi:hypothetical protein KUV46_15565 [Thalassovita mediterranea]|nr:hypothetical protein KUV46_15565 [Thalassovita mediterranea]